MNPSYNEREVLELLQDESTQKRGFELIVAQYSEQLYWQIRRMVLCMKMPMTCFRTRSLRHGPISIISVEMRSFLPGSIASL